MNDDAIEIRPFRKRDAAALAEFLDAGEQARLGESEACCARVAWSGGRALASLRGAILASGFRVTALRARPGALGRAAPPLLDDARARFAGQRLEAHAAPEDGEEWPGILECTGFELFLNQIEYGRALDGYRAQGDDPFTWRSYESLSKAALLALLERLLPEDPLRRLDEMLFVAGAGGEFDAALWRVASIERQPAGVALAHREAGAPELGTLLFMGILPELRGRGLGAALHDRALEALARAGAVRYEDATTVDNQAMQRIFARHGCAPRGASRIYVRKPAARYQRLSDFDQLVDYFKTEQQRFTILRAGRSLRAPLRFADHEAVVELRWLADSRLIQVTHRYPFPLPAGGAARCARAACALNARLNAPGFTIDERAGSAGYRAVLHLDERGGVLVAHLRRLLATVVHAAAGYESFWRETLQMDLNQSGSLLDRVPTRARE